MMISDSKSGVRRPSPTEWEDEVFEMVMDIFEGAELVEAEGVDGVAWVDDDGISVTVTSV